MPYSFELRQEAAKDFADAYNWYEEQKEGLGNLFKTNVYNKLKRICNNPLLYKKSHKNFYEALIVTFPFVIVYTIDNPANMITVYAIFHTSRNSKRKFRI